jgi:ribonuclease HI
MELMAAIRALHHMRSKTDFDVTIVTDSKYVLQGITEWIKGWKTKNWIGSNKQPVKNKDLWEQLDALSSTFTDLKWKWVKGHSGDKFNDMVDELAVSAIPKE